MVRREVARVGVVAAGTADRQTVLWEAKAAEARVEAVRAVGRALRGAVRVEAVRVGVATEEVVRVVRREVARVGVAVVIVSVVVMVSASAAVLEVFSRWCTAAN